MRQHDLQQDDITSYMDARAPRVCTGRVDFTAWPMKSYLLIEPFASDVEEDFKYWLGLAFYLKAKASKKKNNVTFFEAA